MPYITPEDRKWLDYILKDFFGKVDLEAGQFNYLISRMLDDQVLEQECYKRFNELVGMLECAKLEFYRRVIAPYEDMKREKNGDVYHSGHIIPTPVSGA